MNQKFFISSITYSLIISFLSSFPVQAQSSQPSLQPSVRPRTDQDQKGFEIQSLPLQTGSQTGFNAPSIGSPSITIGIPSAYGASWRQAGIGISFQERTRFTDKSDGGIGFGIGFGDSAKNVGVQLGLGLTDVSELFSDGGVISVKVHRQLPSDFAIAAGINGLITWGETDGGNSGYGVVTKKFPLKPSSQEPFSEFYLSVGIGGGQYRSEDDINNGINSVGVFASGALKVVEQVNFITEWTGQDMTIGVSIVPFRNVPFVITPAITDVTSTAGDGTRFILGASYSFQF